jgi:hypothetical protein
MANASEHTTTVFNKIIIPVITTVLGATAIYFLGFNKKSGRTDMEKMLITKDATIKGWKSYVASQNIAYKNIGSITEEYKKKIADVVKQNGLSEDLVPVLQDFKDELFQESGKATKDMQEILKNEDIDQGFVSMLNRQLDNSKNDEKKTSIFIDNLIALAKSNISADEKSEKWKAVTAKFVGDLNGASERQATEAEGIAKILSQRYSEAFDLNELQVYVDYKKELNKKNTDPDDKNINKDDNVNNTDDKEPKNPNRNSENNDNPSGNFASNEIEPTTQLLTGQWQMTDGNLELSESGDMYWSFGTKGYTYGTWKLEDGKIQMNAINPDTKRTSYLVGFLSNVTNNSFTITFMSTPREVYNLRRKNY